MTQPIPNRSRLLYAGVMALVVAFGLPTRLIPEVLPPFVVNYVGDALSALAVFLGIGLLLPKARTRTIFLLAWAVSWGIEFSQLYQADWINAIRANKLGGLILGYTFLPSDLLMYLIGIGVGVVLEKRFLAANKQHRGCFPSVTVFTIFLVISEVLMYFMMLPFMGFAGGNSCPAWLPGEVESWGRFHLPPSFRNLES